MSYQESISDSANIDFEFEIQKIAEDLMNGKAQFLFGAGMSKACGLPTGYELSYLALKEFNSMTGTSYQLSDAQLKEMSYLFPFETLFEVFEAKKKRQKITEFLRKNLLNKNASVNEKGNPYALFSEIVNETGYPKNVLTTNFDTLFEERFGAIAKTVNKFNFHETETYKENGDIPVIHIHGTIDSDEYTITETDIYSEAYNPMMREFEKALYQSDSFIFVGYSMSDPNIKALYRKYMVDIDYRSTHDKKTYVVYPGSHNGSSIVATNENRLHKTLWENRNAIWLPLDGATFFQILQSCIYKLKNIKTRKSIIAQYGNKFDEIELDKKIENLKSILQTEDENVIGFLVETIKA